MKMIIALNNRIIEERISRKYNDYYDIHIAKFSDTICDLISYDEKCVVIIREDIKGKIKFRDLVIKLKRISKYIQIIVIVRKLEQNLKEFLFSKEIFNIIEGFKFNPDILIDLIENPKIVIYKTSKTFKRNNSIICVTGSRGVGKTIFSLLLSNIIAKDSTKRVVVIDLDFISPTLDTYLNFNKNYSLCDYIKDLCKKQLKDIKCYETNDSEYKNLKYILNSKTMQIPNIDTITNIINSLQNFYDYIIVDSSTFIINKIYSIAKENNYNLIHIIEPGKKSLKDFLLDTVYIDKESLEYSYIVCNKSFFKSKLKENKNLNIKGYINFSFILRYKNKYNKKYLRYNLKNILKKINLCKINSLKYKLIDKVLKYKEDNYE